MPARLSNPIFEAPKDPNVKVWRYMDLAKYMSFLESSALFFIRSDQFEDPYEGSLALWNATIHALRFNYKLEEPTTHPELQRWMQKLTFISCWHMSNHESAAMWKLYANSNEAVAIQSTYAKLRDSCTARAGVGKVHYIDYKTEKMPDNSAALYPFVYKREAFEHEKELRAIIQKLPDNLPITNEGKIDTEFEPENLGLLEKINVSELVEKIYIAPTAPNWFVELVKKITKKRYEINIDVEPSSLDNSPLF